MRGFGLRPMPGKLHRGSAGGNSQRRPGGRGGGVLVARRLYGVWALSGLGSLGFRVSLKPRFARNLRALRLPSSTFFLISGSG